MSAPADVPVLVTGGGGFLGRRLVELLLERGHPVRVVARSAYPEVAALGAEVLQADLRDAPAIQEATEGMVVVHHVASKAGIWGERAEFEGINVQGTANVIAACKATGAQRLVYTSTPSVVGYQTDAEGIGEAPYPDRWESLYGETKAKAEQLVLHANGATTPNGPMATVSLRPHLIIGPGDPHLLPRVIARARQRRFAIIGSGDNQVDLTYVDNAAWAHIDAQAALSGPEAVCAGRAYFISNGEPVNLWAWTNEVLQGVGVPPVTRRIPLPVAASLGSAMEWAWRTFDLAGEPRMTRFAAIALARSHWYDLGPAERDLGFRVRVPMEEATARTIAWFREREERAASA